MEIIVHNNIIATYQKQGNDVNGNPIYLVNIFVKGTKDHQGKYHYCNENSSYNERIDKYGNMRIKSYYIIDNL